MNESQHAQAAFGQRSAIKVRGHSSVGLARLWRAMKDADESRSNLVPDYIILLTLR